ncbi:MAG: hypothetical protein J0L85_01435 [Zoogloea sp.]|jgi:hypothetical protein|nr:hypothetical protein [Zoogloea sp.]
MKHTLLFPLLSAAMLVSTPVFAGAGHDHGPKYGGIAREVASVTYELVARPNALTLHVSDHGKPVSTQGARAEVALYAGNEKTVVPLEPAGENLLLAKGNFKVGVGVRAAVTVTLAGKPPAQAIFNLK